ncbi:protein-tyrosine sulfotransferase-like isoform X4 [Zingiber officinale]|uniref:protein-tyrosine sulfotransferase-like isoform X4 n=1 Tax=Zingiber officinale TaxID=94328 RepID=UPI001C4D1626|nr:protein-tyrosine sulfotransferase-like isoform X4 [Zingiber officinale]
MLEERWPPRFTNQGSYAYFSTPLRPCFGSSAAFHPNCCCTGGGIGETNNGGAGNPSSPLFFFPSSIGYRLPSHLAAVRYWRINLTESWKAAAGDVVEDLQIAGYHHSGKSMMRLLYRCGILVVVLLLGSILCRVSSNHDDYFRCESIVRKWADNSNQNEIKESDLNLKDLLLFLHVPRTGGRTYFHCFLRKLYASALECPRSYDKLHFDPRLLVTHDDYSLMSKLPKDRTSVVTILRDPVHRVFSTYEFSVEVAARFLIHPNLTSVDQMSRQLHKKAGGVSTLDIWPWKYLVPWMRQDLFNRRDARRSRRYPKFEEISSPYDMQNMAMPLHEYINHPIAHDIIHNGATFQVAGLTNNSYSVESHDVHNCVKKHPQLGLFVLEVAKHRLNHMLYVGLTEEHKISATMFAKLVGAQVLSQLKDLNFDFDQAATNESEASSSFPDPEVNESNQVEDNKDPKENEDHSVPHPELARQNMTVETLINTYERCVSLLRKSQATRRTTSLKRITPVIFSKQARLSVPKKTLKKIQDLNTLDVALYKHAQLIFTQQKKYMIQNADDALLQQKGDLLAETEIQREGCGSFYGCFWWNFLIIPFFIIIVVILFIRKRNEIKLKK